MLKKISFFFLLVFLLLPLDVLAASSRVFDNASLFSEEDINKLSEEIQKLQDKTQMEVAEEINISQAQVSRLEKKALRSMKNYLG